jgi:probable phosphoglycerate mutase
VDQVSARRQAIDLALDQMVDRDVVFVGHGHFSRRWSPAGSNSRCARAPAGSARPVSVCGFEYGLRQLRSLGLTAHREPVTG